MKAVGERLGDTGRVLLRESGTEPVIRVMAEAQELRTAEALRERNDRGDQGGRAGLIWTRLKSAICLT